MFEAYSVAVKISLINGVTSGLLGMSRQFKTVNADAVALQRRLDGIRRTMLVGGGLMLLGGGILSMFKGPLDEAKKFQTEVAKFSLFGMGDAANKEAERFAKSMNVVGSSYVDNMRLINEAQGVFRESGALTLSEQLAGAKMAAPVLAKLAFINQGLSEDEQARRQGQDLDMLRFIEMRGGLQSAARFNQLADIGFKAIQSSGGNVNWTQLRQFMATGGVATRGMSDQALFAEMEPIIGELKGQRAGTGYMTNYNRLQGLVKLPNQVAHELVRMGVWDGSKIEWNSQGGIKRFTGNPLRNADLFSQSQFDFYEKVLRPAYDKLGFNQAQRDRENALIGGRTGGAEFSLYDRQAAVILRSIAAQQKQQGIGAAVDAIANTIAGKQVQLTKKLHDLMEQTGEVVLPLMVQGLETVLPLLKGFSDWAQANTGAFSALVLGIAGLGATSLVVGAATSLAGLFGAIKLGVDIFSGPAAMAAEKGVYRLTMALLGPEALAAVPWIAIAAGIALVTAGLFAAWTNIQAWQKLTPQQKADQNKKAGAAIFGSGTGFEEQYRNSNPVKKSAYTHGSPYIATGHGGVIQVSSVTMLDGRQIARTVSQHQVADLSRQPSGPSGFDPSLALTPVGAGYQSA